MNKKTIYHLITLGLFVAFILIVWLVDSKSIVYASTNAELELKHIGIQESLEQDEESYYLYFYKSNCPYCLQVKEKIMQINEKEVLYALNCDQEENRGKRYDWSNPIHSLKAIGFINSQGNKEFYDQESEEKYLNIDKVNQYGNKIYYKVDSMNDIDGSGKEVIYAKMITPEINYNLVEKWEDIIIAGVPTLLHVTKGKIDKFYFDAPDINSIDLY